MIEFHLWYLALLETSLLQRFNWESIESQAIGRVVEFTIVYIISNSNWQSLRHMTVKLLLSDKLFVQHILLQKVELIVFLFFSFKQVFVFLTHVLNPVIRINNFIISWFVHILNFVWSWWMNRPPRDLLTLNRHLIHIPYPCGQFSFLECIYIDLYFFSELVGTCVIYNLLVKPLFILLECVSMLSFKSHLHLFVSIGDQLCKLLDIFGICH